MKNLFYTLVILAATTTNVKAQAPGIEWKNIYSRIAYTEYATCAGPTNDGGYIAGGASAGFFWAFKLNSAGTQQWERYITTGTGLTTIYAIKQTADNGYAAAGTDFLTAATDSIGNHGIRDFFVTKMNSSGNVEWMKAYGGTANEEARSIEQTPDGGYIVAGYTSSNDGQVTGWQGYTDCWVIKLDAQGNMEWQKTMGGGNYDYATSIQTTTDGGYIMAGYSGSRGSDVSGTHWGGSDDDMWVVKLDSVGAISWQKSYGGSNQDQAYSIRQTSDGGYIVAGTTTSNDGLVIGKHGTSNDNQDVWVLKLDDTGNITWQNCLGGSGSGIGAGSGNDIAYCVRQATDGSYIVAATVSSGDSTNDDITGYHGHTGSDYWIVKLSNQGTLVWQKCLGGSGTEDVRTAVPTADGGIIVAGTTLTSADGDVQSTDLQFTHPWLVKLSGTSTGIGNIINNNLLNIYPNPTCNYVTVSYNNVADNDKLYIYNSLGALLTTTVLNENSGHININTQTYPAGVYFAAINQNIKGKFVVVK